MSNILGAYQDGTLAFYFIENKYNYTDNVYHFY